MISSVFPGEIPGRSRLALLGRRGFPLSGSVTGKADRGLVTKVNLFYNGLDAWIAEADASGLGPFQSLARGYRKDYQAIQLALTTRWSNAQCEGQICRVKLIKRLGYGRAKLDLLRRRILHRRVAAKYRSNVQLTGDAPNCDAITKSAEEPNFGRP